MTNKNKDDKGGITIIVLVSILLLGLILRLFLDTENLLKDMWGSFLAIGTIIIVVLIANNYRQN